MWAVFGGNIECCELGARTRNCETEWWSDSELSLFDLRVVIWFEMLCSVTAGYTTCATPHSGTWGRLSSELRNPHVVSGGARVWRYSHGMAVRFCTCHSTIMLR
jgi:hypothetical protein